MHTDSMLMEAVLRVVWCFALLLFAALPVSARQSQPVAYYEAERVFQTALDVDSRVRFQIFLTGAGYLNAVPSEDFTPRLFESIQRFQQENGFEPNGVLTPQQVEQVLALAMPKFREWGFREIGHPTRGRAIWVPVGLGLVAERTKNGLSFKDPADRLTLNFSFHPHVAVRASFESLIKKYRDQGDAIHYSVLKPDFFVISKTSPQGTDAYIRYHPEDDGILGFSLFWNNAAGNVSGERVAILTSGSLRAAMTGAKFAPPPVPEQVARTEPRRTDPPTTGSVPRQSNPPARKGVSAGSGYFVNRDGYVITNNHVIEDCSAVRVKSSSGTDAGAVIARDAKNDLALIRTSLRNPKSVSIRIGARLGEQVAAFGFPHTDFLATSGNFTMGNITGLVGIGDDTSQLQMSAPVHAGNSGGGLFDMSGNIVGTVVAKIGVKMVERTGDLPQLLGFAVKAPILAAFLDSNGVSYSTGSLGGRMDPADLADHAKSVSVFITCR